MAYPTVDEIRRQVAAASVTAMRRFENHFGARDVKAVAKAILVAGHKGEQPRTPTVAEIGTAERDYDRLVSRRRAGAA